MNNKYFKLDLVLLRKYCFSHEKFKTGKNVTPPRRGIEPRSPAWQAGILTTILPRSYAPPRFTTCIYFTHGARACIFVDVWTRNEAVLIAISKCVLIFRNRNPRRWNSAFRTNLFEILDRSLRVDVPVIAVEQTILQKHMFVRQLPVRNKMTR